MTDMSAMTLGRDGLYMAVTNHVPAEKGVLP